MKERPKESLSKNVNHTYIVISGMQMIQSLWKAVWKFLRKLDTQLPFNLALALLGIYPRKMKTYVHTKICTQMFIAILFVIVDNCSQSRCHSTDVWLNK